MHNFQLKLSNSRFYVPTQMFNVAVNLNLVLFNLYKQSFYKKCNLNDIIFIFKIYILFISVNENSLQQ